MLDRNCATLDPAEFVQTLHKGSQPRFQVAVEPAPKKPIVGSFPVCCARAMSGHAAAAPPISVMNSGRLMSSIPCVRAGPALP
jgi:hypothetical protein